MKAGRPPVLIAGGGIGGLGAALALARRGFACRVLEREAEPPRTGAGLQLGPNATRILAGWGLDAQIKERGFFPACIALFDAAHGKRLNAAPLGRRAAELYGAPYVTLRRADLHDLLFAAAQRAGVEFSRGFAVDRVEQAAGGVGVTDGRGRRLDGAALVAADGVRSGLRLSLFPEAAAQATGLCAYRAQLPMDEAAHVWRCDHVGLWMAPGRHLVHYPVAAGAAVNIVLIDRATAAEGGPETGCWPPALREGLRDIRDWGAWTLWRLPALPRWSRGAVTLLGDAAHPIPPFLASGAAMAIEDAERLAVEAAASPDDLPAAFLRYEAARRPRTGRAAARSAAMGRVYHMGGLARLARNAVLRASRPEALLARNDWLYGYRAAAGGG